MTPALESGRAYLDYRLNDLDAARARILHAMDVDLQLERDPDLRLLELHRVQSAQNLMRIDLRAGEMERAIRLAGCILSYLEGRRGELPVHHSWQYEELVAKTPCSARRTLIAQVANEVALVLAGSRSPDLWESFLAHAESMGDRDRLGVAHHGVRLWLLAKEYFWREDWDRFLNVLLEVLPAGRADISTVWYSLLLDLLAFCRRLGSPLAISLHDVVLRDSRKWPGLPNSFRDLLAAKPAGAMPGQPIQRTTVVSRAH